MTYGHDLRTPIGAMVTSTQFLLDTGELPEAHRVLVSRMKSTARRMNRLVADLLEFTRTRFGDLRAQSRSANSRR